MTKPLEEHIAELQAVINGPAGRYWCHTPAVSALIAALEQAQQELIKPLAIGELIQRLENQTGEPWGKRYIEGFDMSVKLPQRLSPEGYHIDEAYLAPDEDGDYLDREDVIAAIRTAGGTIQGDK